MLFDASRFYFYIPFNYNRGGGCWEPKPYLMGNSPLHVDVDKCVQIGMANFAGSSQHEQFPVYAQDDEYTMGWGTNAKKCIQKVEFIMLPKKHIVGLDMTIKSNSSTSIYTTSDIIRDYGPPIEMRHSIGLNDFYKYVDAGGGIANKKITGNWKFAGVRRSNTRFVSI